MAMMMIQEARPASGGILFILATGLAGRKRGAGALTIKHQRQQNRLEI